MWIQLTANIGIDGKHHKVGADVEVPDAVGRWLIYRKCAVACADVAPAASQEKKQKPKTKAPAKKRASSRRRTAKKPKGKE